MAIFGKRVPKASKEVSGILIIYDFSWVMIVRS